MGVLDRVVGSSSTAQQPPAPASSPRTVKDAETSIRADFIRKVYTLLSINFLITIAVSCAFAFVIPIRDYIVSHRWVLFASLGLFLAAAITVSCFRFPHPFDVLAMFFFVGALSTFVGIIVAFYFERGAGKIVLQAFVTTAAVFIAITAFVSITKKDFSFLYGFLAAGSLVLLVCILLSFVVGWVIPGKSRAISFAIAVFGYAAHARPPRFGYLSPAFCAVHMLFSMLK